jgi:deferrochelatase/peroxidase EfeB
MLAVGDWTAHGGGRTAAPQGLVFVAFNQDIQRQFATIQQRLETEEMTDHITPRR